MKKVSIIVALFASLLAGCGTSSPIGLVDVGRIVSNWTTYQDYQTQLLVDEQRLAQSKQSDAQKRQAVLALQRKYAGITDHLTSQIRDVATKIANDKQLKLVVTREGVDYGGIDITPDVEKALNITEKPTPAPT